jgi:hypothetical protein
MGDIARNLAILPRAIPRLLADLQKLQMLHKIMSDRRDRLAPIVYHTYERFKLRTTWSQLTAYVDEKLPLSRREYNEYLWFKKDLSRLLPFAAPVAFGPLGCIATVAALAKTSCLPSAFMDTDDIYNAKLKYYEQVGDENRQKFGPLLQYRVKRIYRGGMNWEHYYLLPQFVESYKETFYSHVLGHVRDVRRCEHLAGFDEKPCILLLTNKDPIELTEELEEKLSKCATPEEQKKVLIEAYKHQRLHGLSCEKDSSLALPEDDIFFDDDPAKDRYIVPENFQPLENLKLTGDRVIIPNSARQGMEEWTRETLKLAANFLLLPWKFVPGAYIQSTLASWYEEILQEDAIIQKEGGVQKMSDLELKVALLDRAVMRTDESLTRGDMEARYKEISWLMSKRVPMSVVLAWQTGYYRTTFSPEEDLPEPSLLPKFNRTRLDVDVKNTLLPDERGKPTQVVHPALYPNAYKSLHAEAKTIA